VGSLDQDPLIANMIKPDRYAARRPRSAFLTERPALAVIGPGVY
jgi:hypothetical protein